jgi:hypothetical protein
MYKYNISPHLLAQRRVCVVSNFCLRTGVLDYAALHQGYGLFVLRLISGAVSSARIPKLTSV